VIGAEPAALACRSYCVAELIKGGLRMDGVRPFDGTSDSIGAGATASCGIAFMAKASAPGRAKTRLVPPLTFDEAAALNTAFLCDVADNLLLAARHAAPHGGIAGYAAFGPTGAEDFFRSALGCPISAIACFTP
jgi:hypothetical protein